jgi:hypothetical protein
MGVVLRIGAAKGDSEMVVNIECGVQVCPLESSSIGGGILELQ